VDLVNLLQGALPRLLIDLRDEVGGEVEYPLQVTRRDVEE
jgi:hypothetical protein